MLFLAKISHINPFLRKKYRVLNDAKSTFPSKAFAICRFVQKRTPVFVQLDQQPCKGEERASAGGISISPRGGCIKSHQNPNNQKGGYPTKGRRNPP